MTQPLDGVTVVEIAGTKSAAFAGKLLADVGATVARISKHIPNPYVDQGKLSSTNTARDLLRSADVLLTDLDNAALGEHDISLDSLRIEYPHLVITALSPLGRTGARADWAADDISMQALSGLMHITGDPDREPLAAPYELGSLQLGINGAAATCAALTKARRDHVGAYVEISGAEVLASYVRIYGAVADYYGIELTRAGRRAPGSGGRYPFGLFPCKDGNVALISRTADEWNRFVTMMGSPEWATSPRYSDAAAIAMEYPDEVDALVIPWLAQFTRDELLALAQQHKVPMAPVRRIDEVADDIQMKHRDFFTEITLADGTRATVPGTPWVETLAPAGDLATKG